MSLDFNLLGTENVLETLDYRGATVNCESCTSSLVNDVGVAQSRTLHRLIIG
jgi:hypothetical protein